MNAITEDAGRPRRSRQVRGSRRRNLDRAIGRGRARVEALGEFVAAGGVLTDARERELVGLPPISKPSIEVGDSITKQLLDDMEDAVEEIVSSGAEGQADTFLVPEGTALAETIREAAGADEGEPVRASLINDDGEAVLVIEESH